jgi:hypothetical protein
LKSIKFIFGNVFEGKILWHGSVLADFAPRTLAHCQREVKINGAYCKSHHWQGASAPYCDVLATCNRNSSQLKNILAA